MRSRHRLPPPARRRAGRRDVFEGNASDVEECGRYLCSWRGMSMLALVGAILLLLGDMYDAGKEDRDEYPLLSTETGPVFHTRDGWRGRWAARFGRRRPALRAVREESSDGPNDAMYGPLDSEDEDGFQPLSVRKFAGGLRPAPYGDAYSDQRGDSGDRADGGRVQLKLSTRRMDAENEGAPLNDAREGHAMHVSGGADGAGDAAASATSSRSAACTRSPSPSDSATATASASPASASPTGSYTAQPSPLGSPVATPSHSRPAAPVAAPALPLDVPAAPGVSYPFQAGANSAASATPATHSAASAASPAVGAGNDTTAGASSAGIGSGEAMRPFDWSTLGDADDDTAVAGAAQGAGNTSDVTPGLGASPGIVAGPAAPDAAGPGDAVTLSSLPSPSASPTGSGASATASATASGSPPESASPAPTPSGSPSPSPQAWAPFRGALVRARLAQAAQRQQAEAAGGEGDLGWLDIPAPAGNASLPIPQLSHVTVAGVPALVSRGVPLSTATGIALIFHGCTHDSSVWLLAPKERRFLASLLARGVFAVALSATSNDDPPAVPGTSGPRGCWEVRKGPLSNRDLRAAVAVATALVRHAARTRSALVAPLAHALSGGASSEPLSPHVPLYAVGASSGGYFASLLSSHIQLDAAVMVVSGAHPLAIASPDTLVPGGRGAFARAAGTLATGSGQGPPSDLDVPFPLRALALPPMLFVNQPRDRRSGELIDSQLDLLAAGEGAQSSSTGLTPGSSGGDAGASDGGADQLVGPGLTVADGAAAGTMWWEPFGMPPSPSPPATRDAGDARTGRARPAISSVNVAVASDLSAETGNADESTLAPAEEEAPPADSSGVQSSEGTVSVGAETDTAKPGDALAAVDASEDEDSGQQRGEDEGDELAVSGGDEGDEDEGDGGRRRRLSSSEGSDDDQPASSDSIDGAVPLGQQQPIGSGLRDAEPSAETPAARLARLRVRWGDARYHNAVDHFADVNVLAALPRPLGPLSLWRAMPHSFTPAASRALYLILRSAGGVLQRAHTRPVGAQAAQQSGDSQRGAGKRGHKKGRGKAPGQANVLGATAQSRIVDGSRVRQAAGQALPGSGGKEINGPKGRYLLAGSSNSGAASHSLGRGSHVRAFRLGGLASKLRMRWARRLQAWHAAVARLVSAGSTSSQISAPSEHRRLSAWLRPGDPPPARAPADATLATLQLPGYWHERPLQLVADPRSARVGALVARFVRLLVPAAGEVAGDSGAGALDVRSDVFGEDASAPAPSAQWELSPGVPELDVLWTVRLAPGGAHKPGYDLHLQCRRPCGSEDEAAAHASEGEASLVSGGGLPPTLADLPPAGRLRASLAALHANVRELLNDLYAQHEMTAAHAEGVLAWMTAQNRASGKGAWAGRPAAQRMVLRAGGASSDSAPWGLDDHLVSVLSEEEGPLALKQHSDSVVSEEGQHALKQHSGSNTDAAVLGAAQPAAGSAASASVGSAAPLEAGKRFWEW